MSSAAVDEVVLQNSNVNLRLNEIQLLLSEKRTSLSALQAGIATLDSSAGGLGGCPYAPGASGNLATEDLLYMLHGMGIETGVDLKKVAAASRALAGRLGHALPSRYLQATPVV